MAIFLKNSWNVIPARWGSPADVQYAIKVNAEKIYNVDPDTYVLITPLFWGFPVIDYSNEGNHGTDYSAIYKAGRLNFNGLYDYVDFGKANSLNITNIITVHVRFKLNVAMGSQPTDFPFILEKGNGLATDRAYGLFFSKSTGNLYFSSKNFAVASTQTTWNVNQWYNIHGIYDVSGGSNNVKLYIDRNLDNSATDADNIYQNTYKLYVGKGGEGEGDNAYWINGSIDSAGISNVIHNADQISLFTELPYGLYQKVSRPFYLLPIEPTGWTGKINTVTNPAKINGIEVANIAKVNGVS